MNNPSSSVRPSVAFLFPGQGSQAVGMGKELYERYSEAQEVMDLFSQYGPADLKTVMFDGPEEKLRTTLYTQPAILAHSLMAWRVMEEHTKITPCITAGHSLGEFGALVAARVLSVDAAAQLVCKRAALMNDLPVEAAGGKMAAVLGLPVDKIKAVVQTIVSDSGKVFTIANENGSDQTVISGDAAAMELAEPRLKEAGAKRVVILPVSGAFHSPLMQHAADQFAVFLEGFEFQDARIPVISNIDGQAETSGTALKQKLKLQIPGAVKWTATMDLLAKFLAEQSETQAVVELGPGAVLTGMMKRAYGNIARYTLATPEQFEADEMRAFKMSFQSLAAAVTIS